MDDVINDGQPFIGFRAQEHGVSASAFRDLWRAKAVRRVLRGVYVDSRVADTRALRAAALHLVAPSGAAFFGATAAFLHGVDAYAPKDRFDYRPHCVVPHHATRSKHALVVCHEGYLPPQDLIEFEGLVLTTPLRSTVDMMRFLWRPHALAAADAMAHAGLVTAEEIRDYIKPMRRFPGIVQARSLSKLVDARAESKGESWQRLRLVDAGLPFPESQVVVRSNSGIFVARLDHGYRDARVGIEYDGREFHSDAADKADDHAKRDYLANILGWRLWICTREQIFGDDPAFEKQIALWLGLNAYARTW